jgi:hypothetical protein
MINTLIVTQNKHLENKEINEMADLWTSLEYNKIEDTETAYDCN